MEVAEPLKKEFFVRLPLDGTDIHEAVNAAIENAGYAPNTVDKLNLITEVLKSFTKNVSYLEYLGSGHLDGTDIHEAVDAAAAVEKAGFVPRFYTIDTVIFFLQISLLINVFFN